MNYCSLKLIISLGLSTISSSSFSGDDVCWDEVYNYQACCIEKNQNCWDSSIRPEICCFGKCMQGYDQTPSSAHFNWITSTLQSTGGRELLGAHHSRLPAARRETCLMSGMHVYAAKGLYEVYHRTLGVNEETVGFVICVPTCVDDVLGYVNHMLGNIATRPLSDEYAVSARATEVQFLEAPGREWYTHVFNSMWWKGVVTLTCFVICASVCYWLDYDARFSVFALQHSTEDLMRKEGLLSVAVVRLILTFLLVLGHVGTFSSFPMASKTMIYHGTEPWGYYVTSHVSPLVCFTALSGYLIGKSNSKSSILHAFGDLYVRMIPTLLCWYAFVGFVAYAIPTSRFEINGQQWWTLDFHSVTKHYNEKLINVLTGVFWLSPQTDGSGRPESASSYFSLFQMAFALRIVNCLLDRISANYLKGTLVMVLCGVVYYPHWFCMRYLSVHRTVVFEETLAVGLVAFLFAKVVRYRNSIAMFVFLSVSSITMYYIIEYMCDSASVAQFFFSEEHQFDDVRKIAQANKESFWQNPVYGLMFTIVLHGLVSLEKYFGTPKSFCDVCDLRVLAKLSYGANVVHYNVVMFIWDAVLTNHMPMPSYTVDLLGRSFCIFCVSHAISLWNYLCIESPCLRVYREVIRQKVTLPREILFKKDV